MATKYWVVSYLVSNLDFSECLCSQSGGCNEGRAVGKAPLYRGDPPAIDGDGDGFACETFWAMLTSP